jgi:hypothetical protein
MIKIGITGSRYGTDDHILNNFFELFGYLNEDYDIELHHGDCIGVDSQIHNLVNNLCKIIIHPPSIETHRAFSIPENGEILPSKDYLKRNKDIVTSSDITFAFPTSPEVLHSGTWSTIRLVKKLKKQLVILYKDGTIESFNMTI